jgi:mRNA interferase RelE/StbE
VSYEVSVRRKAEKAIARLPDAVYQRVRAAIRDLANDPRPSGCIKLSGREGYRIRVGRDYRVLYRVDDRERRVEVFRVSSREGAYRG